MAKLCFLISNDYGGGIAPVVYSLCKQAAVSKYEVSLLSVFRLQGRIDPNPGFRVESLDFQEPEKLIPQTFISWLNIEKPQYLFINACEEIEPAIPYISRDIYVIYVVHDTANIYWNNAVKYQEYIDAICSVSHVVNNKLYHEVTDQNKCYVIHNGSVFPELKSNKNERLTLLFLGGEKLYKGVHDLLELLKLLNKEKKQYQLFWCGHVSTEIQKRAKDYKSLNIIFTGQIPHYKVFKYASKSHILLMLSRVEPFGMATIEAMSMGCVPLAWDIETGTKEIVDDKKNGILVPLGNFKGLNMAIHDIMNTFDVLSANCIQKARSNFSVQKSWENYDQLIHDLSLQSISVRPLAGTEPPKFVPPHRLFQKFPKPVRRFFKYLLNISPRLSYALKDRRGV